ncbi:LysR family transcriptional regulator [uncultured Schumannella sp.]|uniref:LysR family transcriptional regulator n=1 Tax=uncultured Schumannella sp. TaxID=1195956 RepID=UPI0025DB19D9|nr:LysR family transcriptional regulator [uncultured Schumannella sp.]
MDVEGVRTFVAAADLGQFQEAAVDLGVTQQAVSKRIAALERQLGVALFTRTPRGTQLTVDGQAFLPHARELLRVAVRAAESVQPEKRALRVDVIHRRIAPAVVLQDFHRAHPEVGLDVVTLANGSSVDAAIKAIGDGVIDASFRALTVPWNRLPKGVMATAALNSKLEVLVGPHHPLANRKHLSPKQLADHRVWIPGIVEGTEWAAYYEDFAGAFDLTIDALGPHFGDEALMDQLAESANLATIVGDRDRYLWPAQYDLRRIPLRAPTPMYPYSFLWLSSNPHPGLVALRSYLDAMVQPETNSEDVWLPPGATV